MLVDVKQRLTITVVGDDVRFPQLVVERSARHGAYRKRRSAWGRKPPLVYPQFGLGVAPPAPPAAFR